LNHWYNLAGIFSRSRNNQKKLEHNDAGLMAPASLCSAIISVFVKYGTD
jgi:hypothetical protein